MKAWVFQFEAQVAKLGADKASWYVGYHDPTGKRKCRSCGPGFLGKKTAQKLRDKIHAELTTGTFQQEVKATWPAFRQEYEEKVLSVKGSHHAREANRSLG